jgi:Lrp/AsnC family transcriptional regulator for asnA, asnC and gidA
LKPDDTAEIYQQIDDINLKIIDILNKDASTSFVDIAKRIGVSDATIHIRVRRMMEARIITNLQYL